MSAISRELVHKKIIINKEVNWDKIGQQKITETEEELVSASLIPEKIVVRPYYFIQGIEGAKPECYVRSQVLDKLVQAAEMLPRGYKLVIFDAWRSFKVQQNLYKMIVNKLKKEHSGFSEDKIRSEAENYVAPPSGDRECPSPHMTGGAVDLSIVDESGKLLNMGTAFDTAKKESHTDYYEKKLNENKNQLGSSEMESMQNRRLLFNIMTSVGFTNYPKEWWHYDYGNQNWAYFNREDVEAFYGKTSPDFIWEDGPPVN
ncbi:MAG: M15 family metallopeptidase [Halanaerobiales bacterium]